MTAEDPGTPVRSYSSEIRGFEAATRTGADGQTLDESKYIVIWKRVGDEWNLHRDILQ